jgi:hypothetical protein
LKDAKFNSEKLTLDPCVSLFELLKPLKKSKLLMDDQGTQPGGPADEQLHEK